VKSREGERKNTYKAGSNGDHIELVVGSVLEQDASLGELLDGVALDVDEVDVLTVELFVVVVLEARALDSPVVRPLVDKGREQVALLGVADARAHLLGPELVRLLVGLGVEEGVLVAGDPEAEAALGPEPLVRGPALLGSVVKGVLLHPVVREAGEGRLAQLEELRVQLLVVRLVLLGEVLAAHGERKVGGPLEDGDGARLGRPGLDDLDTRGTGADDGAALAGDLDLLVGPEGGVVEDTLELVHALPSGDEPVGRLWVGQHSCP
jgi:hypothetical protein